MFADVRGRGVRSEMRSDEKHEETKHTKARVRFLEALARAVRRVDETARRSSLRSASGDPNETRVVAADVAAATAARLPKIGLKAARRLRQEEKRKNQRTRDRDGPREKTETSSSTDWLGDAWAWISNVVAPPPDAATDENSYFLKKN